jgi:hypothetical protein
VFLISVVAIAADGSIPAPTASLAINSGPVVVTSTLAFVSENLIAIARYPGSNGTLSATIITVEMRDGSLRPLQKNSVSLDRAAVAGELYAAAHGGILSKLTITPQLLSGELKETAGVPLKITMMPPVHQAGVVADLQGFTLRNWSLYRLGPPLSLVRSGTGEVLSVSDEFVVFRGDHEMRVERIDGTGEGSFQVPARSTCYERATILGRNRLLATDCKNEDRVVDFNGKELIRLPPRDGWGFRFGQSLDGNRVLFDNYTRRIPLLQSAHELLEALASLGMGPNIESKGEEIRVVDTITGSICFDLDSPSRLFGRAGEYHADISPSGLYVAVLKDDALSVYRLPNSCASR